MLFEKGVDINVVFEGDGMLLIVVVNNDCFGFVRWLIVNGVDIDVYVCYDEMVLIFVVWNSDVYMVCLLVDVGVDVNFFVKIEVGDMCILLGEVWKCGCDIIM